MRTRLGIFCDKFIEAGWLTALLIVPLFFNIYSQRVFEPDKLSLLRSLTLAMSAAWVLRLVEDWRARRQRGEGEGLSWRQVAQTPLVLATLLLVLVYVASTITSVDWRVSLLGSYQRLQGTYTTLSYVVIFFLVLEGLRTKRQLNRVINTAILVSFPIAMYGLIQHFGVDPLPWGGSVTTRVASNMGNAIFVAAFLILVVPLTLSRLLENWRQVVGSFDTRDGLRGVAAFVLLVAALLLGMLVRRGESMAWLRWVALAVGAGLQVPIYLSSPADRRPRVLSISLPLTFAFLVGFSWILEIFFPPAPGVDISRYLWLGILAALIFVLAMAAFAYYLRRPVSRLLLLSAYFVILITQLACIFYTQSRGPLLGLLGGGFAYFALLGLVKRRLWLPWLMTGAAALAVLFLILFNTARWPFIERLRETPYIGRLGKVLQTEEGTGKVRVLIWEGVTEMISPHEPLQAPGERGGPDRLNALRPILGYGPESMYVAYNRFYPPDLAHYEKRNASPDRSHNETFDALAITGVAGFLVYMFVFASVFYHGLKWLGLIRQPWQSWAFVGLWIAGGILGVAGAWAWRGPAYLGVGVPVGVMLGLAAYGFINLLLAARGQSRSELDRSGGRYALWLVALVSAIVAHFIEIHFGIAIAATRTYFWVYAALLLVIGSRLATRPAEAELATVESPPTAPPTPARPGSGRSGVRATHQKGTQKADRRSGPGTASRKQRKPSPPPSSPRARIQWKEDDWLGSVLLWSLLGILLLSTLLFDFVTIQSNEPGVIGTIWQSLTRRAGHTSPAMLVLLLCAWATVGLLGLSDLATREESVGKSAGQWLTGTGLFLLVTFLGTILFGLLHANQLKPTTLASADAPNPLVDTIVLYYLCAFIVVTAAALVLTFLFRRQAAPWRWTGKPADLAAAVGGVALILAVALLVVVSNLTIVRADILYKQGLSSEKAGEWEGAIFFYQQAISLAPRQDFYYLFLGRALMEKGRAADAEEREELFQASEQALLRARDIAPLNTDHSANLARLYRTWGSLSTDPLRTQRLRQALSYYADATSLSPHSAQLFNEWGQTYLALGESDQALSTYQRSLALDSRYSQTYALIGELYLDQSEWAKALDAYRQAIEANPRSADAYSSMGYAYSQQNNLTAALAAYRKAAELQPNSFANRKNLAIIYQQLGQVDNAISEATEALKLAPDSQKRSMESYLAQLRAQSSGLSAQDAQKIQDLLGQSANQMDAQDWAGAEKTYRQILELDANNAQAHSGLAYVYAKQGQVDQAITENLVVLDLLGDDYTSYRNLAVLYENKGQVDKARQAAQQALALAPEEDRAAIQAFLDQLGQAAISPTPQATPTQRAGDLEPEERNNMYSAPPAMALDPGKSYVATIVTDKGEIVLELYADKAPRTVNNFVFLARQGFYDNTTFHRVIPGFMAQGGDPTGSGRGGPGYRFADEIDPTLRFDAGGILAMANAGPNTNGSQFFITYSAAPWLDGSYTIFGRLIQGMEVLQSLTPRDPQQNPDFPGDTIRTIGISEK